MRRAGFTMVEAVIALALIGLFNVIGTYLAACVVYASLYNASPVGNPYDYYGKIDKETAAFLQTVADKTVRAFYGQLPAAAAVSATVALPLLRSASSARTTTVRPRSLPSITSSKCSSRESGRPSFG